MNIQMSPSSTYTGLSTSRCIRMVMYRYNVGYIMINMIYLYYQTADNVLLMLLKPCPRSPSQTQTAVF